MKKLYYALLFVFLICSLQKSNAQLCDSIVPVFTVDLTGQPNGTWTSPWIQRAGHCCAASGSDKCIDFEITLDSAAMGIRFDICGGAVPPGALYYQINCGPPVAVGEMICLNGPGPHILTFCKPGNNTNQYCITSIPQPSAAGTEWVSDACTGMLIVSQVEDTSITWTSVPFNATYNSYLSCTQDCDTVIVTPTGSFPAYVDYAVCGMTIGGCDSIYFCDTIRVNFVTTLSVNITPQNPVICFGAGFATVTANPSGGHAPFTYSWSTGQTTQAISVGAGTYIVQITDSMNCAVSYDTEITDSMNCAVSYDTVIVNAYTMAISANAGLNQLLCSWPTAQLNGTIVAAGGGLWYGGSGTYSPNDTMMNAVYTPSASEISAGFAHLYLVTTSNLGCPADTDDVIITISTNPTPSIAGTTVVCENTAYSYSAPFVAGMNYSWSTTGGSIISTSANNITVVWGSPGTGTITLTETNPQGCDSTITINISIGPIPTPSITGAVTVCTGTTTTYNVAVPVGGNTYNWSIAGGVIVGSSTGTSINVQWSSPGSATISVYESNSYGCNATTAYNVNILLTPSPVITGTTPVCAGQTMTYSTPYVIGNTYTWNVTGGNIISSSSNTITVYWPSAVSGTVTVTENNTSTCDSTVTFNVIVAPQPAPVISGITSVCTGTSTTYSVTNPTAGNNYLWSVAGGMITGSATGTSVNIQWNVAGTATITLYESNSYGCDSTVSQTINVLLTPTPTIAGPSTVCAGQTMTYTTPFVAGNTYSWNVIGGNTVSVSNNSITIYWPTAGNGNIIVIENNTSTCSTSDNINVLIAPQPVPVITGPATVCTGTSSTFAVSNPTGGNSYLWTVVGGMIVGSNSSTSVNIQWNTAGTASISVYESNAYGCDSTVSVNVNVLQTPSPNITGLTPVCAGQTMTYTTPFVAGNTYNWNVIGGNIVTINNNSITITWPAAVTGTITVIENNTSTCSTTDNMNVVVAPQPAPVITGPATVCTGTSSTFAINSPTPGNSYLWTVVGGMIVGSNSSTSVNIQWSTAGTASISIYESNPFGCDSTVSVNVNVLQTPSPNVTGLTPVCAGQTMIYTTPFVAGNTYNWNVTGGNVVLTNNNTITITWPASGTGTITVIENNTLTCADTMNMNVIVAPQPAPVITGTATVCTGTSSAYTVTNPTSGNSYAWTVSGGAIIGPSNTTSINVQWNNPGTATISVYESNSYSCDSSISFTVNVLQMPSPNITGNNHICAGNTATYTTPLVPGNSYNWNVTGGTVVSTTNNQVTVTWPNAGIGSLTVTESNTSTCVVSVTYNVNVGPQPVPVISGTTGLCWNTTGTYVVSNPTSGNSYAWTITGGTIIGSSSGTSVNVHWTTVGIGTLTVYESNTFGCDSTVTINVDVNAVPAPVLSGVPKTCVEETRTYSVPDVIGHTYLWTVTNGSIIGFALGHSIDVYWPNPGSGYVSCKQISPEGCDSIVGMNVTIDPLPNSAIAGPSAICEYENAFYGVNQSAGSAYNWSVTGGTTSGSTNGSSLNVNWPGAGNGYIVLSEIDINGCSAQHTYPVIINLKPHPQLTGDAVGCVGTSLNQYSTEAQSMYAYNWSVQGGAIVSGNGTSNINVYWSNPGTNYVTITVSNTSTGCDSTVTIPITVEAMPHPMILTSGSAGCAPHNVDFTGSPSNSSYNYTWHFGDGYTSTAANPGHQFEDPGTYNVNLIVSNSTGCVDTAFATVTAYNVPNAAFSLSYNSEVYTVGMSELFLNNLTSGGIQYLWDFGTGDMSTFFEPSYEYEEAGTYTITLYTVNQWGCKDETQLPLVVKFPEDVFIPNAFSPNGDNNNDLFSIKYQHVREMSIKIFNRWGEAIFTADRADFTWDGTMNGNPVPEDVYVYHIKAKGVHGKTFDAFGHVTVVR
jgi:gliding motility-associated-like protein